MADKEVRAKVTITADPTALGKALKEVQAEAKKLNSTAKKFDVGQAADRVQQGIRERAAVQSELIRRGVIEDPKVAEAARKMRQDAELRRQSSQSLALQGLSLSGMGGAVGGFGHGQAIGGALEGMGFAGLARFAGPVGLAVGTAAMNAEMLKRQERFSPTSVYADPYMDPMTRARGNFSAMPFGETILSYSDTFSGRTAGMQRNEEARQRMALDLGFQSRLESATMSAERRMAYGQAEREATTRFQYARPDTFDRSTEAGRLKQREADALVEPRKAAVRAEQELLKATREREFLERNGVKIAKERRDVGIEIVGHKKLENDLLGLQQQEMKNTMKSAGMLATAVGVIAPPLAGYGMSAGMAGVGTSDYSVGINAARGSQAELGKRALDLQKQLQQNSQDLAEAKLREAAAQRAKGMSAIEINKAELGNLQAREQVGSSAAVRIGMLGPAERARGLSAMNAIKEMGIENASSELKAWASAVDPGFIERLAERSGIKQARGEFGDSVRAAGGGFDLQFAAGLDDIRADVNKKRGEIPGGENLVNKQFGEGAEEATKELRNFIKFLGEELPVLMMNLKNDMLLMRNGIGG
jgi:hypothetical protein